MAGVLQHLRSSTLDKRPNPASMVDGQVAINYASGAPGMFFKDSNGALVKVGPVHVGSGAPNAVPASGGTAGNSMGEQWLDTSGGTYVFKIWDGSAWRSEAGEFVNVTGDTMTGALGIIAGSAASPSLFISGDTNTGIYSPGADQLAISTNGVGRLFIDASGNVGVATGSPNRIFDVKAASGNGIALTPTAGNATNWIDWFDTGGGPYGRIGYDHQNSAMLFYTVNSERMRLDSSGRLGLGTSSPSTYGAQLAVIGGSVHADRNIGGAAAQVQFSMGASSGANFGQIGNTGTRWSLGYGATANTIGTEVLVWNSSGQVGIGTTTVSSALHVIGDQIRFSNSSNASFYGTITHDAGSTGANIYNSQDNGGHIFQNSGTERTRIDSSGRLLVGTSSWSTESTFIVQGYVGGSTGEGIVSLAKGAVNPSSESVLGQIRFTDSAGSRGAAIISAADGAWGSNDYPGRLVFSTTADGASSPTERVRITNGGLFKASDDATYVNSAGGYHEFSNNASSGLITYFRNKGSSSPIGIQITYSAASPNNTGSEFLYCSDSTAQRASIRSNGGLANYSANNVNLSDRNAKKDIAPAVGTWDCLKEWEIVNFRYKDQPDDADLNLGVIAQQVAESCPEVITVFQEATEDQPEKLGVKDQQMMWMAIKALQEAQLRIETLEAKVIALESN